MSQIHNLVFRSDMPVELVKSSAADSDVIFAARVSTQGDRSLEYVGSEDASHEGLINYLMRGRHGSPFEHTSFTFFIEAPIFVFREFHRHRAGWSYNEQSARYSKLQPVFYVPDPARRLVQEGSAGHYRFVEGSDRQYRAVSNSIKEVSEHSYGSYLHLLSEGVAREVARMCLPVNIFSSMYATCNARSLMHFLSLRTKEEVCAYPSYPQVEIEMVARKMEIIFREKLPLTYAAWVRNGRAAP